MFLILAGMFHWCPSRELSSCLMDRQEAAMTVLQVRIGTGEGGVQSGTKRRDARHLLHQNFHFYNIREKFSY